MWTKWKFVSVGFSPVSERAMLCFGSCQASPLVLLITVVLAWRRSWSINGMIMTGEKRILGPPQISHRLPWDRTQASELRDYRISFRHNDKALKHKVWLYHTYEFTSWLTENKIPVDHKGQLLFIVRITCETQKYCVIKL